MYWHYTVLSVIFMHAIDGLVKQSICSTCKLLWPSCWDQSVPPKLLLQREKGIFMDEQLIIHFTIYGSVKTLMHLCFLQQPLERNSYNKICHLSTFLLLKQGHMWRWKLHKYTAVGVCCRM